MVSPCLFTRQRALKMGYFYCLRVKNSNHIHTELSLGDLENAKFYLESKASFIDISSIASFKLFLIAWLWEYCTFSDSYVVSLLSSPWPKYTQLRTIFQKKYIFHYQTFLLLQICSLLDCSQQIPEKKIGGHRARLREKDNLFRYRTQCEGNLLRFVRACAHERALRTRKSCAVRMRNAILRNHVKSNHRKHTILLSLCTNQKIFCLSAERPRYQFSARGLRRPNVFIRVD